MFRNFQAVFSNALQFSKINFEPKRTTFILRRKNPIRLNKKDAIAPRKLKRRDFYYLLEEDTNTKKQELLDLILLKKVQGIGNPGEIIQVRKYTAYECFIVSGAATYATPENVQKYGKLKRDDAVPVEIQNLMSSLKQSHIPVFMNDTNPWILEPWHIKLALKKMGVICNEDCIKMPEKAIAGPSPDLEKKDFAIHITVNKKYVVPMRCRIFHLLFSEVNYYISFNPEFYLDPINPIFPEEEELLKSLPLPQKEKKLKVIMS